MQQTGLYTSNTGRSRRCLKVSQGDAMLDSMLNEDELEAALPVPQLAKAKLDKLDQMAQEYVATGDKEGLIRLKLRVAQALPKEYQGAFLKADAYANYRSGTSSAMYRGKHRRLPHT